MPDEERLGDSMPDAEEEEGEEDATPAGWTPAVDASVRGSVFIATGRGGDMVEVQVGAPFVETVERVADEAHYGGAFKVYLNGRELYDSPWLDELHTQLNPEYPGAIEPRMDIAIASYEKVGW